MAQGRISQMVRELVFPEEELARKKEALRIISSGLFVTMGVGEAIAIIIWLFNPYFIIIPITLVLVSGMAICAVAYWLVRVDQVQISAYFFVTSLLAESAIITPLFGGFAGPMRITYLFSILTAGMVISVNACFLAATLATILYLVATWMEKAGYFPRVIPAEVEADVIAYLTISIQVVFFYLIAYLSWFAASRLTRALQRVTGYAAELQTANERLRASEEELKASNEELRATEEELRASNEELEAANEELRATQEQLIRSEKLAAIGQLAGGVGHELRNPLGAIKNAVYYIRGKISKSELPAKDPRLLQFLDIMDSEINVSNKIINDLLGFSRIGRPAVSPARIKTVVEDALSSLTIPENVEIVNKLDTELPEIAIDTDQIRQVVMNIAANAVQAMPEGGKLTIDARKRDRYLELAISDTGHGMEAQVIPKIFDPLFTTKAKGIGLGLAVCKSIVERHEGIIEVQSRVGEGTTFTVKLPFKPN